MAINAGIDMAMEPYDLNYCTLLKELVQEKKIPMSVLTMPSAGCLDLNSVWVCSIIRTLY